MKNATTTMKGTGEVVGKATVSNPTEVVKDICNDTRTNPDRVVESFEIEMGNPHGNTDNDEDFEEGDEDDDEFKNLSSAIRGPPLTTGGGVTVGDTAVAPEISVNKSFESEEDEDDEFINDMEGLLAGGSKKKSKMKLASNDGSAKGDARLDIKGGLSNPTSMCCGPFNKVGNVTILFPSRFKKTGWGVMGPHWFGPPCVLGIILLASTFFILETYLQHRLASTAICVFFTVATSYFLVDTAYRDPGLVMRGQSKPPPLQADGRVSREYRWCELCQNYQPPTGVHCPDCNVCVAGFDHHCVWMGTCIGRNNFQSFVRFNLCWLLYFLYVVVWVTILAPIIHAARTHHHHHHSHDSQPFLNNTETNIPTTEQNLTGVVQSNETRLLLF